MDSKIGPTTTYEPFPATVICRRDGQTRVVAVFADDDEFYCTNGHRMEGV